MRRVLAGLGGSLLLLAPLVTAVTPAGASGLPPIGHVWVVVLENQSEGATFAPGGDPGLQALARKGAYIPNYFGVAHESAPNYIAMISGQAPTPQTQADCQAYQDLSPGNPSSQGQVVGQGCIYPGSRSTIGDQLTTIGRSWKAYMEDLDNTPSRDDAVTCAQPKNPPQQDPTQKATAQDQYAARHDPFMYFHSVIDNASRCRQHVVPLQSPGGGLLTDLKSVSSTPSFSLIAPNLCNDGHDTPCIGSDVDGNNAGGLTAMNHWLGVYVPAIMSSPAFKQDGMLVVTFDEGEYTSQSNVQQGDSASCCNEPTGPNTTSPGISGAGGGQVGAVVLSPFVVAGTTTSYSYNHYSLLRTIEDVFAFNGGDDGRGHLGYAGYDSAGNPPVPIGSDVFTNPLGGSHPASSPRGGGTPSPYSTFAVGSATTSSNGASGAVAAAASPSPSAGATLDPAALAGGGSPVDQLPGDVAPARRGSGGGGAMPALLAVLAVGVAVSAIVAWRRGVFARVRRGRSGV